MSDPPGPAHRGMQEDGHEPQVSETLENILDVHAVHTLDGDGPESQVFITYIDSNSEEHKQALKLNDGWNNKMSADFVNTKLGWIGDEEILGRKEGSMIVMTVNSRGRTDPGPNTDKMKDKCRLPYLTSLVTSGLVDIVIVPEANLNEEQARHATRFVQLSSGGRVRGHSAPTSTAVSTMEHILAGSPVTRSSSGGLLVLMKSEMFDTLISTNHY